MVKRILTYVFLLAFLTSCWDYTYPGQKETDEYRLQSTNVRVSVGGYDMLPSKAGDFTKGSGPIDNKEDMLWRNDSIYVFSFHQDAPSYTYTSAESGFEDENPPVCLVDGSRDNRGSKLGKLAHLTDVEFVEWDVQDFALKYPGGNPNGLARYNFFGYYVDDFKIDESAVRRTEDEISFPVVVDGTRDYMTARAILTEDQLAGAGLSKEERLKVPDHVFCSYTANMTVHPQLYFEHHLCRLDFELYPGNENCDGLYIQKVELRARTKAEMTVVHKDVERMGLTFPEEDNPYVFLNLKDENGKDDLQPDKYMMEWKEDYKLMPLYNRPKVVLGRGMLLIPEKEYVWIVHMKGKLSDGSYVEKVIDEIPALTCDEGGFLPGNKYFVRLALYGIGDLRVEVSTVAWNDGGEIYIDGEDWGQ